jgi:hypothetical protein
VGKAKSKAKSKATSRAPPAPVVRFGDDTPPLAEAFKCYDQFLGSVVAGVPGPCLWG